MAQETVLLLATVALLAMVLVRALLQAVQLVQAKAQVVALEQELVRVRSELVLAKAREWEFHRESGKAREMD